jgi:RNA polymerase sigma-70 factor (ECF subfamily)
MTDASLAARVRAGDTDAFTACYRAHAAALDLQTYRIGTGHWAEDARQEAFARFWARPERYDPTRGTLRTFLQWDTAGRSIDLARSETSRRHREDRHNTQTARLTNLADTETDIERSHDAALVRAALLLLPETEREAIVLAFYGDITYKQVAIVLDQPEGTIKSRIRRGMQRLAKMLAPDGFGPVRSEPLGERDPQPSGH